MITASSASTSMMTAESNTEGMIFLYDIIHPKTVPWPHIIHLPFLMSPPSYCTNINHEALPNMRSPHLAPLPPSITSPPSTTQPHPLHVPHLPPHLFPSSAIELTSSPLPLRSYNSCYESFDQCYPKPYCPPKEDQCHKCEYKQDNCGKKYGGYVSLISLPSFPFPLQNQDI